MTARELAEEIKNRVTMRECAERYGYEPDRAGFILCPFHQENTPSFKCYDGARGFSCYGCGEYGSVIDFVQKLFGLTFRQAIARMDADFGLRLPIRSRLSRRERREAAAALKETARKREELERRREDAEGQYWLWFTWWLLLEQIIERFAPSPGDDEWDELFVLALRERALASEALERAEIVRMRYAG